MILEKHVFIFGVGTSSSTHTDNRKIDISTLGQIITQGLDYTAIVPETKYSINFNVPKKKFCLSLYYI